jgi:subtilase family serine protease
VSKEQVWGWDGLQDFLNADVAPGFSLFSTGSGGGVSVYWSAPWYQQGYPGVKTSASGQVITYDPPGSDAGTQTLLTMPAGYKGRNVPDVSADADPFSGYLIYAEGGWYNSYGGTSFVAPQLNGVTALLRQRTRSRLGLENGMLYRYAEQRSRTPSVVDITAGDNWYYKGIPGYDAATGVGVLDVNNYANQVASESGCD